MMVGRGTGMTVTDVETVLEFPAASVTVPEMRYVSALLYTCDTTAVPEMAPRDCGREPSPQITLTSRTALPFVAATVTANVNDAGKPALGGVAGGVITRAGAAEIVTLTDPDDCPVAGGVVVPEPVPVPVPPPVAGACAPTLAVTVAGRLVVSTEVATPSASAVASDVDKVPAVVEKLTGAELSPLPLKSKTAAVMVVEPPVFGTDAGLALTVTRPTAAVPTAILMAPAVPVDAPPEIAVIVAIPFDVPAENLASTRPLMSVSASGG